MLGEIRNTPKEVVFLQGTEGLPGFQQGNMCKKEGVIVCRSQVCKGLGALRYDDCGSSWKS